MTPHPNVKFVTRNHLYPLHAYKNLVQWNKTCEIVPVTVDVFDGTTGLVEEEMIDHPTIVASSVLDIRVQNFANNVQVAVNSDKIGTK